MDNSLHQNDNNAATAEEISRYLLVEQTSLCHADLGIVFGNRHCHKRLAARAAELYHQGYFPEIIVSGGRPNDLGHTEGSILRHHLMALDVPREKILVEQQAINTPQNVIFSRMAYGMSRGLTPPIQKNVICIGSATAGRRFLMTMANYWPEAFAMASNVNPFDFPLEEWPQHKESCSVVRNEFRKAVAYKTKGDIKEITLEEINSIAQLKESRYNQLLPKGL